ncbi:MULTISPECIES: hypothetical protein [Streptomyces]|uniref:Helix-turn-helix domain-containing protein n=1 Tax=Streptomyces qinglanensis TaxID=943816 RepID=A0A1H9U5N8_9ACTN|nr:hypothetical protein [Streptomyces qinglanensis]SES04477.1 hypothetical protein SAMN05421870_107336 [Streptomyces qinglanensis]
MKTPQRTESPHLTAADLAARWCTTENAIYIRRHKRQLPPTLPGRKLLWKRDVIEAFEAAGMAADPKSPANDPAAAPVERAA